MQEQEQLAQIKEAPLVAVQSEESDKIKEFQNTLTLHMQQQNEAMRQQQNEMQKNYSTAVHDMQSTLLSEFRAERLQFQQMMQRMVIGQKETLTDQNCPEPPTSMLIVSRTEPPVPVSQNPAAFSSSTATGSCVSANNG